MLLVQATTSATTCMCIALLLACVVEVLSLHVLMLLVCVLCMYSSKYYNMYVHCITTSMCSGSTAMMCGTLYAYHDSKYS